MLSGEKCLGYKFYRKGVGEKAREGERKIMKDQRKNERKRERVSVSAPNGVVTEKK